LTAPYFVRNARSSSKLTAEGESDDEAEDEGGGEGGLMAGIAL
jgi:hypothetical protein